jgi:hypothetical protein
VDKQDNVVSFPEKAATDQNATKMGIVLNALYAAAGIVSAVVYGRQVYAGIQEVKTK